jgi:hypothetical protein
MATGYGMGSHDPVAHVPPDANFNQVHNSLPTSMAGYNPVTCVGGDVTNVVWSAAAGMRNNSRTTNPFVLDNRGTNAHDTQRRQLAVGRQENEPSRSQRQDNLVSTQPVRRSPPVINTTDEDDHVADHESEEVNSSEEMGSRTYLRRPTTFGEAATMLNVWSEFTKQNKFKGNFQTAARFVQKLEMYAQQTGRDIQGIYTSQIQDLVEEKCWKWVGPMTQLCPQWEDFKKAFLSHCLPQMAYSDTLQKAYNRSQKNDESFKSYILACTKFFSDAAFKPSEEEMKRVVYAGMHADYHKEVPREDQNPTLMELYEAGGNADRWVERARGSGYKLKSYAEEGENSGNNTNKKS